MGKLSARPVGLSVPVAGGGQGGSRVTSTAVRPGGEGQVPSTDLGKVIGRRDSARWGSKARSHLWSPTPPSEAGPERHLRACARGSQETGTGALEGNSLTLGGGARDPRWAGAGQARDCVSSISVHTASYELRQQSFGVRPAS